METNLTALMLLQLAGPAESGVAPLLPEPGAIILLLLGLGMLLFVRRRRRHHEKQSDSPTAP
jgi:hypothetical protein